MNLETVGLFWTNKWFWQAIMVPLKSSDPLYSSDVQFPMQWPQTTINDYWRSPCDNKNPSKYRRRVHSNNHAIFLRLPSFIIVAILLQRPNPKQWILPSWGQMPKRVLLLFKMSFQMRMPKVWVTVDGMCQRFYFGGVCNMLTNDDIDLAVKNRNHGEKAIYMVSLTNGSSWVFCRN